LLTKEEHDVAKEEEEHYNPRPMNRAAISRLDARLKAAQQAVGAAIERAGLVIFGAVITFVFWGCVFIVGLAVLLWAFRTVFAS